MLSRLLQQAYAAPVTKAWKFCDFWVYLAFDFEFALALCRQMLVDKISNVQSASTQLLACACAQRMSLIALDTWKRREFRTSNHPHPTHREQLKINVKPRTWSTNNIRFQATKKNLIINFESQSQQVYRIFRFFGGSSLSGEIVK